MELMAFPVLDGDDRTDLRGTTLIKSTSCENIKISIPCLLEDTDRLWQLEKNASGFPRENPENPGEIMENHGHNNSAIFWQFYGDFRFK